MQLRESPCNVPTGLVDFSGCFNRGERVEVLIYPFIPVNAMQCSAAQCNVVKSSAMQCHTVLLIGRSVFYEDICRAAYVTLNITLNTNKLEWGTRAMDVIR